MEKEKKLLLTEPIYLTGIILILISLGIYWLSGTHSIIAGSDNYFGIFFINYGITVLYFILLLIKGFIGFKFPFFKIRMSYIIPFIILLIISGFALNREVCLFEKFSSWVIIMLIVQCIVLLAIGDINTYPPFIRNILSFCVAFSIPTNIYFVIYLTPFYVFGLIGSFFIGISLHVFSPLLLLLVSSNQLFRSARKFPRLIFPALTGLAIPFIILVVFIFSWAKRTNEINYVLNSSILNESEMPGWIKVSQHMTDDPVFEKIIKSDLLYTVPSKNFEPFRFDMPRLNFEDARQHDPLIFTACLFATTPDLSIDDKIKILESKFDARHQTQDRLWSGNDLKTANVISNIKIFPENRLAYTEKILSVKNTNAPQRGWNQEREAIYTFHLPEGGVVTSLSLWIKGIEEKGILTTKSKADTAYKTIVGRESRDPSVIHWQEGNTVSVRIFPCTADENRRFKIGITTPLKKQNNKLIYENIFFDGPPATYCTESAQVQFDKPVKNPVLPAGFSEVNNLFTKQQSYQPYWEISFDEIPVSNEPFSFDGKNYSSSEYSKQFESFTPSEIYLDLNRSWNEIEFKELWEKIKGRKVYATPEEPILLDENNHMKIFADCKKQDFSLFPFHKIESGNVLVISKSSSISPQLKDLENSVFGKKLKNYFSGTKNIRLFNIGDDLSPYLKSLKEVRAFAYSSGNIVDLLTMLGKNEFIKSQEDEHTIVIDNSSLLIKEDTLTQTGKGSDHLMRLFAYNSVLKQIGKDFFTPEKIGDNIIKDASKAWIVSPVSSLIVLETQADYNRFEIEKSKNSLNNASIKGNGAVPEPHEVFLVLLVLLVVFTVYFNPFKL